MPDPISRNVISEDVEIRGTVMFQSTLVAHGRIEGDILTPGVLVVGANGTIDGDIQASSVSVSGRVNGNVTVDRRCELKGDAELIGDVDAPMIAMDEGVTFVGQAKIQPRAQAPQNVVKAPAPAPAPQAAPAQAAQARR